MNLKALPILGTLLLTASLSANDLKVEPSVRHTNLGDPPRPSREIRPIYSPDGTLVAFNSNRSGLFDIYILDVATREVRQVTRHKGNNYVPKWSPDGTKLMYYSNYMGNPWSGEINHDVYIVDAKGGEPEQVTSAPSNDMFGTWLPDGKGMVFASNRDRSIALYTMNFQTKLVAPLLADSQSKNLAMFQPMVHQATGNIVFEGRQDGVGNIWFFDDKRKTARQLTHTPDEEYGPSISPDGTRVLFQVADANGHAQIGLVNIDGSGYRLLTSKGSYVTPIWGPRGNIVTTYTDDPEPEDPRLKNWNIYTLSADGTGLKRLLDW